MSPRTSKDPEVRRAEFIAIATRLFRSRGFAQTSVDDIVAEAQVAKGTFYYYFQSKDQVLEAVVETLSRQSLERVAPVLEDRSLGALEKLRRLLAGLRAHYLEHSGIIDEMHALGDDAFHYKSLLSSTTLMSPALADIFRQGVDEGVFRTEYPDAVGEILLLASNFLLDAAAFPADDARMRQRILAIQHLAERALDLPAGSLNFISDWEE